MEIRRLANPVTKPTHAGTTHIVRHARSTDMCLEEGEEDGVHDQLDDAALGLTHPPTRILAVPIISLVNIRKIQNWHMTKVDPSHSMKKQGTAREMANLKRTVLA